MILSKSIEFNTEAQRRICIPIAIGIALKQINLFTMATDDIYKRSGSRGHYLLLLLITALPAFLYAQTSDVIVVKRKPANVVDIDTLIGIRNKKIVCEFDTLYTINRLGVSEFVRCVAELNKVKELTKPLNSLANDLTTIHAQTDSIHTNIKSLTAFMNRYDSETSVRLNTLTADNAALTQNMLSVTKELQEAQQKIKAEKWKSMSSKLIWGAGGLAVGGLLFTGLLLMK